MSTTKGLLFPQMLLLGVLTTSLGVAPIAGQPITTATDQIKKIGDFALADPNGWTRLESSDKEFDVVSYYKILGTDQVTLTFSWMKSIDDGKRRIARDRSLIKAGKSMFTPSLRPSTRYKVVSEQLFTLNGIPAVMHKTITKSSDRTDIGETIRFTYKHKFYVLTRGFGSPSSKANAQAQAVLNQGWRTLTKNIKASGLDQN